LNNLRRRDKWEEPELGLKGSFIISELWYGLAAPNSVWYEKNKNRFHKLYSSITVIIVLECRMYVGKLKLILHFIQIILKRQTSLQNEGVGKRKYIYWRNCVNLLNEVKWTAKTCNVAGVGTRVS
jgi:hypothetical protein